MSCDDSHRTIPASSIKYLSFAPPFSCFQFLEDTFGVDQYIIPISRIFSLARSNKCVTVIIENIDATGIIREENIELIELFPDYKMGGLYRISFWHKPIISTDDLSDADDKDLSGYLIVKCDITKSMPGSRWHVFESVFCKFIHQHNYTPFTNTYCVGVSGKQFHIEGSLYCQQNSLNKACAHVALRSILSNMLPEQDISYKQINQLARTCADDNWLPSAGLAVEQMRRVLDEYDISYRDVIYEKDEASMLDIPYPKFCYSGVESGGGALIGFELKHRDPDESSSRHIIPLYGHTFNKDTWVPDADSSYFQIGPELNYIPSESWTSSFLGHDDNFGPNYCIPRLYVKPEQVQYVVEIFPKGIKYSGLQAEAMGISLLYSTLPQMLDDANPWFRRLINAVFDKKVVLRAVAMSRQSYVDHLGKLVDSNNNEENKELIKDLEMQLPEHIYLVEVSLPQLFPANERKLGEIVLDATKGIQDSEGNDYALFQFIRLPGTYLFGEEVAQDTGPTFFSIPSILQSHTPLFGT
jgi:hypothetical protein